MTGLTIKEKMTLDFARTWWKYGGAKEAAIREMFGESSTRYYQRLNAIIDKPEAVEYDALLVKRLQRLRAQRRSARQRVQDLVDGVNGFGL